MALDYESFDTDDFQVGSGKKGPGRVNKRAEGWMGKSGKETKQKLTPESRILQKLSTFEPKKNNTQREVDEKLQAKQDYLSFIRFALSVPSTENLLSDKDLVISYQNDGQLVNVRHTLTGFYEHGIENAPLDVQIEVAKDGVRRAVDSNIKDWRKVSPEFRESQGIHVLPMDENSSL